MNKKSSLPLIAKQKKCFTLIELIVVIAIIAVLSAIVAPNALIAIEKAKASAFCADYKTWKSAVNALYGDTGRFAIHYENIECPLMTGGNNCGGNAYKPLGWTGWDNLLGWDGPYIDKFPQYYWGGGTRFGSLSITLQNSCDDGAKDWDGDPGCEIFFCYQPYPPVSAEKRIDQIIDDGDGPKAGSIQSRISCAQWCQESGGGTCFWPLLINQ